MQYFVILGGEMFLKSDSWKVFSSGFRYLCKCVWDKLIIVTLYLEEDCM